MQAMSAEWALAVRDRGMRYVRQMPEVMAFYDDGGEDQGRVIVLGPAKQAGLVTTRIPGTTALFDVPADCLSVEDETAAHLTEAAEMIAAWAKAGPLTGRHYNGNGNGWRSVHARR